MEKQELTGIVERLLELSGEKNDRKLSVWLGKKPSYISMCRIRNTIDFESIISKCGNDPAILAYIITGKKNFESNVSPQNLSDREIGNLEGKIEILQKQVQWYEKRIEKYDDRIEAALKACEQSFKKGTDVSNVNSN